MRRARDAARRVAVVVRDGVDESSAPAAESAAGAAALEAAAVCDCGCPAFVMKPRRRAVARALLSVERSFSSSNSFRAAKSACSSIVHARCGSARRAKDAIATDSRYYTRFHRLVLRPRVSDPRHLHSIRMASTLRLALRFAPQRSALSRRALGLAPPALTLTGLAAGRPAAQQTTRRLCSSVSGGGSDSSR